MADDEKKPTDDKKPADDKPEEKFAVKFKTEGDFLSEVDRKTKSAVNKAVSKAVEEAQAAFMAKLGIEAPEEIDGIAEKVKTAKVAVSETDKLRNDLNKLTKAHTALTEQAAGLQQWKQQAIKGKALASYSSKVVDLETLAALVLPKMVIGDDDSVTGPNGKSLDDVVEEIINAKPFLRPSDYKSGAGTGPGGGKSDGKGKDAAKAEPERKPNGKPLSLGQTLAAELRAKATDGNLSGP